MDKKIKNKAYGAFDLTGILQEIIYKVIERLEIYSVVGVVSEIDESKMSCTVSPVDDAAPIMGVRLQGSFSLGKGHVFVPKDQSKVIVTFLNKDTGFISNTSEIEKIIDILEDDGSYQFSVKDKGWKIDSNGIVFNGGNNGGLPVTGKTIQRLNKVENDINNLKNAFSGWTPVSQDGGAALKLSAGTWFATQLTPSVDNDIINNDIKQ